MKNILCIGMANVDVSVGNFSGLNPGGDTTFSDGIVMTTGGDAFNTAHRLRTMGLPVSFAGTVGSDAAGDFLLKNMEGMDTAGVLRDEKLQTAICVALVQGSGQRHFIYNPGANVLTCGKNITERMLEESGIVHAGGVMQMAVMEKDLPEIFERAHRAGCVTSMDITYDSEEKWLAKIAGILPHTDIFLPSIDEARRITGLDTPEEMREYFSRYPMKILAVKLGKKGCYVTDFRREAYFEEYPLPAVDTTGAGDSYVAGFLGALQNGEDCFTAAAVGNVTGGVCVTCRGACGGRISYADALVRAKAYYGIRKE